MKDLCEQLAERFGMPMPEPAPDTPTASTDPFGPTAHLESEWLRCLRKQAPRVQLSVKRDLSLPAARQLTDKTLKALKKSGMRTEHATLQDARAAYLKKREKLAWARLKAELVQRGGSQKAYRALKQSNINPEKAFIALGRLSGDLSSYGAAKLRDALST